MNAAEIADICRELAQFDHQPEKAMRLRHALDPDQFPTDVDQRALFAGVDLWPALARIRAHVLAPPGLWPIELPDDLESIAAACEDKPVLVAPLLEHSVVPFLDPTSVTDGRCMNPAALAAAIRGDRKAVGDVYRVAAALLGDGDLSQLLKAIGSALRASPSADKLWAAARPRGLAQRRDIAERYAAAASWLEKGGDGRMPHDLAAWISKRLAAMAEAIIGNDKPANAVYLACGAGRQDQRGRFEDGWTAWRNAAIAEDVKRLQQIHPDRKKQAHYLEVAERWFPSKYFPAKPDESEGDRIQRHAELVKRASRINSRRT